MFQAQGQGGGLNALLTGPVPSTQLGFPCQYTHLGAGFPFASHSIKMLSRGSTMWSFTDCLVMVGGWDTAIGPTVGGQGSRDLPWSLAWGTAEIKSFGSHTDKQASRWWTVPHSGEHRKGAACQSKHKKNPCKLSQYPHEKLKAKLLFDPFLSPMLSISPWVQ